MGDDRPTIVVFRMWQGKNQTVIALFPEETADSKGNCMSYEHVGQHGAADYAGCLSRTRAATPAEYALLKKELEDLGYHLDVRRRYTRPRTSSTAG